ncbi:GNAT family N-acetyltransferase [Salinarimonas sp.]|uniref:GNAT family N-acetyltransferase n=1 Tax=Salinarimonas sp. TaxID=2766526 RepID=UPI00391C9532
MPEAPAGYRLAQAGEGDLDAAHALVPGTARAVLDLCRAGGTLWIAREADGALVGLLAAGDLDGAFHIHALAIAPAHRRRGLASALVARAIDRARWALMPAATLVCERDDAGALALAARTGFVALDESRLGGGLAAALARDPGRLVAMGKRV